MMNSCNGRLVAKWSYLMNLSHPLKELIKQSQKVKDQAQVKETPYVSQRFCIKSGIRNRDGVPVPVPTECGLQGAPGHSYRETLFPREQEMGPGQGLEHFLDADTFFGGEPRQAVQLAYKYVKAEVMHHAHSCSTSSSCHA